MLILYLGFSFSAVLLLPAAKTCIALELLKQEERKINVKWACSLCEQALQPLKYL